MTITNSTFDGYYWHREENMNYTFIYKVWYQRFGSRTSKELFKTIPKTRSVCKL